MSFIFTCIYRTKCLISHKSLYYSCSKNIRTLQSLSCISDKCFPVNNEAKEYSSHLFCHYVEKPSLVAPLQSYPRYWSSPQSLTVECRRFLHNDRALSSAEPCPSPPTPEKLSVFKRFKAMYRDYWYVLVPVHLITSAVWFGAFYYMASSGVDVAELAAQLSLSDETVEKIRRNSHSVPGYLAISYLLYKICTPLRYTVTLGGTTVSINYLKKWGYIKPIPKREDLRKMFNEQKESLRHKSESFKERRDLMKRTVLKKLSDQKRGKQASNLMKKILHRKKNSKLG